MARSGSSPPDGTRSGAAIIDAVASKVRRVILVPASTILSFTFPSECMSNLICVFRRFFEGRRRSWETVASFLGKNANRFPKGSELVCVGLSDSCQKPMAMRRDAAKNRR
jgi:hypothetical protein